MLSVVESEGSVIPKEEVSAPLGFDWMRELSGKPIEGVEYRSWHRQDDPTSPNQPSRRSFLELARTVGWC